LPKAFQNQDTGMLWANFTTSEEARFYYKLKRKITLYPGWFIAGILPGVQFDVKWDIPSPPHPNPFVSIRARFGVVIGTFGLATVTWTTKPAESFLTPPYYPAIQTCWSVASSLPGGYPVRLWLKADQGPVLSYSNPPSGEAVDIYGFVLAPSLTKPEWLPPGDPARMGAFPPGAYSAQIQKSYGPFIIRT